MNDRESERSQVTEGGHGASVMLILSTLGATESSIPGEWGLYSIALEWPLLWLLFSSPEELESSKKVRKDGPSEGYRR